jgi:ankyrin repeat protein
VALIAAGVDVNGVDKDDDTALHLAAGRRHHGVCEVLVGRGANVGAVNKDNGTAAALARSEGHEGVAAYLDGLIGRGTSGR